MKIKYSIAILLILLISLLAVVSSASNKIDTAQSTTPIVKPDIIKGIKVKPDIIIGKPDIIADFTATPLSGDAPLKVQFHETSTINKPGTLYGHEYNFGDGESSKLDDVAHTYKNPGNYIVSLKVYEWEDPTNVLDTKSVTIRVSLSKSATFKIDLAANRVSGNVPLTVHFHDRSIIKGTPFGGRYWDFASNDANSQEKDPVYTFREGGLYEVTLEEWAYGFNEKKASILIGVNDPNANPCAKKGPNWAWVGGPSYCPTCEMTDIDDITTSEHHDCIDPGQKKIEGKYVSSS